MQKLNEISTKTYKTSQAMKISFPKCIEYQLFLDGMPITCIDATLRIFSINSSGMKRFTTGDWLIQQTCK